MGQLGSFVPADEGSRQLTSSTCRNEEYSDGFKILIYKFSKLKLYEDNKFYRLSVSTRDQVPLREAT
jgi:hypothetical protein